MGFFDCRCMVTGVSLKGCEAQAVLLRGKEGAYHPIAPPILGSYDRLGSIDGIEETTEARRVLEYFRARLQSGDFTVDAEYDPIEDVETLLRALERSMNDCPDDAALFGEPVPFALISAIVWDTIVEQSTATAAPFGDDAVVAESGDALPRVHAFLAAQDIPWTPTHAGGQHDDEEVQEYFDEARARFRAVPILHEALNRYEARKW